MTWFKIPGFFDIILDFYFSGFLQGRIYLGKPIEFDIHNLTSSVYAYRKADGRGFRRVLLQRKSCLFF